LFLSKDQQRTDRLIIFKKVLTTALIAAAFSLPITFSDTQPVSAATSHDTVVKVTNLENGKAVKVSINDRGPYGGNRVIDLSRAAARKLHMTGDGTARVRIEVAELPGSDGSANGSSLAN